jgi:hypothetical protein
VLSKSNVAKSVFRLRIIIYKKGLEEKGILIKNPNELGGTSSNEYLKLNPQGATFQSKLKSRDQPFQ